MKHLLGLLLSLWCGAALAGSANVNYTSTGSSGFRTTTDGTTNCVGATACNLGNFTLWDSVSGANGLAVTTRNSALFEGVGSAGTATGGVVTVQGVAAMTPLLSSQSGTWTVQPGNTANTTPWLINGATSNASSAVATSTTNVATAAYNFGFNGTTWDQLQVDGSKNLKVNCISGCAAVAISDNTVFNYGSSSYSPIGGVYNTSITNLTSGSAGAVALTIDRNMFVNLNKIVGAVPSATNPLWIAAAQAASVTMQNAAVAIGAGTALTVTGYQTVLLNVNCSVACSGGTTIVFEGTDSTGNYFSIAALPVTGTTQAVTQATTSGQFWVPVAGLTTIRARISVYSAGTITVTGTPINGVNANITQVANANTNGQAVMANSSPVVVASDQTNLPVNLKQIGGATLAFGQTNMASSIPIVVASDQSNLPDNIKQVGGATLSLGQTTQSASIPITLASDQVGPCTGKIAISQTTSTDLYTSVAKVNICSVILISATAQSIALVEGTGSVCATGTAALIGGTSASMSLAANGGISSVAGLPWLKTQTTADHLCLLQSGAGNISGVITYLDHS